MSAASNQACWVNIADALFNAATAAKVYYPSLSLCFMYHVFLVQSSCLEVGVIFLATDALGATSNTYMMKADQKVVVRKLFSKHVIESLEDRGMTVVMSDHTLQKSIGRSTAQHGSAAFQRLQLMAAVNDLLVSAAAKNFVHMYGSLGPGADLIEGCEGARAGSCFGNWILKTRDFRKKQSEMLSSYT